MSEPIIVIDQIAKHYAGVKALRSVSFEVAPGEIVGLIGANGAGKSTLIDVLSGVTRPTSGTVMLDGHRLRGGAVSRSKAGLARTFQHPHLAAELTVGESIACATYGGALRDPVRVLWSAVSGFAGYGARVPAAEEVARRFGFTDLRRPVSSLSFGELRMVEFACAVVQEPRLIMLDEPGPGVGEEGLGQMLAALSDFRNQGRGVLLVDHNLDVVSSIVDRIVLLVDGEIVLSGPVAECVADPLLRKHYIGVV
jgi:branched-chain amino acid transport system ATP-binding protein